MRSPFNTLFDTFAGPQTANPGIQLQVALPGRLVRQSRILGMQPPSILRAFWVTTSATLNLPLVVIHGGYTVELEMGWADQVVFRNRPFETFAVVGGELVAPLAGYPYRRYWLSPVI